MRVAREFVIVQAPKKSAIPEVQQMEPITTIELDLEPELDQQNAQELLIHEWRAEQLRRLGLPQALAEAFASHVDWHELAALVGRGCPPMLALEIVR